LRARACPAARLAGTCSPRPKYISSGVCPAKAACGTTVLCCSTYHAEHWIMPSGMAAPDEGVLVERSIIGALGGRPTGHRRVGGGRAWQRSWRRDSLDHFHGLGSGARRFRADCRRRVHLYAAQPQRHDLRRGSIARSYTRSPCGGASPRVRVESWSHRSKLGVLCRSVFVLLP
jgi:hypothetical protein